MTYKVHVTVFPNLFNFILKKRLNQKLLFYRGLCEMLNYKYNVKGR